MDDRFWKAGCYDWESELIQHHRTKVPDAGHFPMTDLFDCVANRLVLRDDAFESLWRMTNPSASPGLPYMYNYATNKKLGDDRHLVKKSVEDRINKLIRMDDEKNILNLRGLFVDPAESVRLVRQGLTDPIRVFGKAEPIKLNKMTRNVSSSGIVDFIIDKLLFSRQMNVEIEMQKQNNNAHYALRAFPSTIGWDMNTLENRQSMFRRVRLMRGTGNRRSVVYNDISGFEYSYGLPCYKLYQSWWEASEKSKRDLNYNIWRRLMTARFWCMVHIVFMTTDGELYAPKIPIMCSGRVITAHGDTIVRSILPSVIKPDYIERYPHAIANGDDCVEECYDLDTVTQAYADIGFKVTDVGVFDGERVHFCSQILTEDGGRPESYGKALFNLLSQKKLELAQWLDFENRYIRTGVLSRDTVLEFVKVPTDTA